jgi:hypothetical protein
LESGECDGWEVGKKIAGSSEVTDESSVKEEGRGVVLASEEEGGGEREGRLLSSELVSILSSPMVWS